MIKKAMVAGSARNKGRNYSHLRGVIEAILAAFYHGGWAARAWGLFPFAYRIETTRYTLRNPALEGRKPLKIGFVSDFHLGPTTPRRLIERAIEILESEKTDVALFGGDFVFLESSEEAMRFLGRLLGRVSSPVKLAVMGNHDIWTDRNKIAGMLEAHGVRVLVNESVTLPAPYPGIAITGLDDPRTGIVDTEKALAGMRGARFNVVLCHSPNGAFDVIGKADLFLAGHTHGGQISLPGGLPVILPKGEGCRKWSRGSYDCGGTRIIVSRGVGGTELPIRMFARPEVTIVTLQGA